jgi:hypothetical protein
MMRVGGVFSADATTPVAPARRTQNRPPESKHEYFPRTFGLTTTTAILPLETDHFDTTATRPLTSTRLPIITASQPPFRVDSVEPPQFRSRRLCSCRFISKQIVGDLDKFTTDVL